MYKWCHPISQTPGHRHNKGHKKSSSLERSLRKKWQAASKSAGASGKLELQIQMKNGDLSVK